MKSTCIGIAALALLAAGCSREQGFVGTVANGGRLEVKLGEYAATNAANPEVRQFAQEMVDDHTRANQNLDIAAKAEEMKVPADLEKKQQETYDQLTKLKGEDFDRAYMKQQVKAHEDTVAALKKEIARAPDTQLGRWASTTLPTVEAHLQHARALAAEIKAAER